MRLLDLFCGGGGAAMGYHRAGFDEIVGVDIAERKNYPFQFVQGDALEYLEAHGGEFDAIHASPPCQKFVSLRHSGNKPKKSVIDSLTPSLVALRSYQCPWVVENVMTASMPFTIKLCGSSFGLRVQRHRKFCSNMLIPGLPCRHKEQGTPLAVYGENWGPVENKNWKGRRYSDHAEASAAMGGLDWMTIREICEAIPPAYTEHIGHYLMQHIKEATP